MHDQAGAHVDPRVEGSLPASAVGGVGLRRAPVGARPGGEVEVPGTVAAGPRAAPPRGPTPVGWLAGLGLLAALGVALPLAVAAGSGALGIPRSDDWSYLLVQFHFVEDGTFDLNNWVSMTLVGQVVLGAPVAAVTGRSITAMQVFTAIVGLVGLAAVVDVGRRLLGGLGIAVVVAVMVAVSPLWGPLAVSFMTDVPAFTFGVLSLLAGMAALARRPVSMPLVAAALGSGLVGFSIRQYGAIPPLAVVVAAAWVLLASGDRRRLRLLGGLTAAFVVLAGALFVWWRGLPNSLALTPTVPDAHSLKTTVIKGTDALRLLGLLATPALVLAGPVELVRDAWRRSAALTTAAATVVGVLMLAIYEHVPQRPFVGNYVSRDGVLAHDVLVGHRPDVLPAAVFGVMVVVGSVAAMVLAVALGPPLLDAWDRLRAGDRAPRDGALAVVAIAVAGYGLAYVAAMAVGLPMYDRYVLPLVPLVSFLLLRRGRLGARATRPSTEAVGWRRVDVVAAGVALVLLGGVGLVYTVDSAAYDGARWDVAATATRRGLAPLQIDGGFEWDSYHLGFAPSTSRPPNSGTARRAPDPRERALYYCAKVLVTPTGRRGRVVATRGYRVIGATHHVVVLWTRACRGGRSEFRAAP